MGPPQGNIRELENIVERVMATSKNDLITAEEIRHCLASISGEVSVPYKPSTLLLLLLKPLKEAISEFEREIIQAAFLKYKSSRKVAKVLKVNQSTVIRKAMKYGITWENKNMNRE